MMPAAYNTNLRVGIAYSAALALDLTTFMMIQVCRRVGENKTCGVTINLCFSYTFWCSLDFLYMSSSFSVNLLRNSTNFISGGHVISRYNNFYFYFYFFLGWRVRGRGGGKGSWGWSKMSPCILDSSPSGRDSLDTHAFQYSTNTTGHL